MSDKSDIEAIARKKSSHRSPKIWLALLVAAFAAGGVWYWQASGSDAGAINYTTTPAAKADIVVTVSATGTIEPVNTVEISSELSGTVRAVNADYNDMVKKGDVLAELDTDKLEANVEHAEATLTARNASLAEAQVTLEEKKAGYDRSLQLSDQGISTQETLLTTKAAYQRAVAALDTAKANVKVAEADLKLAKTDLDKSCICSPIDGVVLDRTVEVGQIVAASLSAPKLFTLAEDLSHMNLTVDIDEADIGQVAVGNAAHFTVEAYQDRSFNADIVQLRFASETVDGVVTYKAILDVDNDELLLRPGMTATAEITVAELDDVLTVPNAALRFSPPATAEKTSSGGSGLLGMLMPSRPQSNGGERAADAEGMRSIWILRDGAPAEVKVRTGRTDGASTQIAEGDLKEGDAVITDMDTAK
ncbi:MAG: efflux RND transporter periplasmic adaptor subunit [Oricola sp.]